MEESGFQRTFTHAMELWFEPEIRRRQDAGVTPKPYPLRAAQVILYADGRPNQVRLNEEVQAVGEMRLKDGVFKEAGEPVYLHELEEIPAILLPSTEDANCGHFTLLQLGESWYGAFDFRYNKGKASELLEAAEEFFVTAAEALSASRMRAAIDNLYSAAELAAKAFIITTPLPGDEDIKSHGPIHSRFNMFARHGNVEANHRRAFNSLSEWRTRARYVSGPLNATAEQISNWKIDIEGLLDSIRGRVEIKKIKGT